MTITVESNDARNTRTVLYVSVLVELEFGFEQHSLNMGRVHKGQSASKRAILLLKDLTKRNVLEVGSQSPHVTATVVGSPAGSEGRLEVEVAVGPEMPPGRMNVTVSARLTDGSYPDASLRVNGIVLGNVEVTPRTIRIKVDTSQSAADQVVQKVRVVGSQDGVPLRLLGVKDRFDRLAFEIDTLIAGKQFEIMIRPNRNGMELGRGVRGEVIILTDDPEQSEVRVPYSIIFLR